MARSGLCIGYGESRRQRMIRRVCGACLGYGCIPMLNLIQLEFGCLFAALPATFIWVGASTMTGMRWGGGAEQVAEFLRSLLETIGLPTMGYTNIGVSFYLVVMGRPATEHHPEVLAVLEECRERSAERKTGLRFGGGAPW